MQQPSVSLAKPSSQIVCPWNTMHQRTRSKLRHGNTSDNSLSGVHSDTLLCSRVTHDTCCNSSLSKLLFPNLV